MAKDDLTTPPAINWISASKAALQVNESSFAPITMPSGDASDGVTLQMWLRLAPNNQGITLYSEADFGGHSMPAKGGIYPDLGLFPASKDGIGSFRIPEDWAVIFFSEKDCKGEGVYRPRNILGVATIGHVAKAAQSMIVYDLNDMSTSHAVRFENDDLSGQAELVPTGRIVLPDDSFFASFFIPPSMEIVLYQTTDFTADPVRVGNEIRDLTAGKFRSAIVTKPHDLRIYQQDDRLNKTDKAINQIIPLLTDGNALGLSLKIQRDAERKDRIQYSFGGTRLRLGKWVHLASTFDGSQQLNYIDGRLVETSELAAIPDPGKNGWSFLAKKGVQSDSELNFLFDAEIAAASLYAGVMARNVLSANRHHMPSETSADLIEGWPLNVFVDQCLSGVVVDISDDEMQDCYRVSATLPRSILQGKTAQKSVIAAKQTFAKRSKAQELALGKRLVTATDQGARDIEEARAKAIAASYTVGVEAVVGFKGMVVQRRHNNPEGYSVFAGNGDSGLADNNNDWDGQSDIISHGYNRLEDYYVTSALQADNSTVAGKRQYWMRSVTQNYRTHHIIKSERPMLALAVDPSGEELHALIYWIDDQAKIYRIGFDGENAVGEVQFVAQLFHRQSASWTIAINEKSKYLILTNGHEIWRVGRLGDDEGGADIIVPHAVSPNPIAATVDEETDAIYWIDARIGYVMRCDGSGKNMRKLYPAPAARPGIALDYFDMSGVADEAEHKKDTTHKRLYWTAEPTTTVAATLISEPGPFAEIAYRRDEDHYHTELPNLIELTGTKWHGYIPDFPIYDDLDGRVLFDWIDDKKAQKTLRHRIEEFVRRTANGNYTHEMIVLSVVNEKTGEATDLPVHTPNKAPWFQGAACPATGHYLVKDDDDGARLVPSPLLNDSVTDDDAGRRLRVPDGASEYSFEFQHALFSKDGAFLKTFGGKRVPHIVWDTKTGKPISTINYADLKSAFKGLVDIKGTSCGLHYFPDGRVEFIELATGQTKQTLKIPTLPEPDDMFLNAAADQLFVLDKDGGCHVWDVNSGLPLKKFLRGGEGYPATAKLLKDETQLLMLYNTSTLVLWDIATGQRLAEVFVPGYLLEMVSSDECEAIIWAEKRRISVPLLRRPHPFVHNFQWSQGAGKMHPIMLDCTKGFGVAMHIRPDMPTSAYNMQFLLGATLLFSIGEAKQGQIEFVINSDRTFTLTVTDKNGVAHVLDYKAAPVEVLRWSTICVTISDLGWATISANGTDIAHGQVCPVETGIRTGNRIAQQANWSPESERAEGRISGAPYGYIGYLDVMRFWNRELTEGEIQQFHAHPGKPLAEVTIPRNQGTYPVPAAECMLMSGMDDGSTPAVPMVPFITDGGLFIRSKGNDAHAKLISADHARADAYIVAAKRRAAAHAKAAQDMINAHQQQADGLTEADRRITAGHAKAKEIKAPAEAALAKARDDKKTNVTAAKLDKTNKTNKANADYSQKVFDARKQYDDKVSPAQANLSKAQDQRDKSAFASDGSTLKEHQDGDD